jgi:dienelactone hydrolase
LKTRVLVLFASLLALLTVAAGAETAHDRAVQVLSALSRKESPSQGTANDSNAREVQAITLAVDGTPVPARLYVPRSVEGRAMVLLHGVHRDGILEQRLTRFAQELARVGVTVLTPELADLASYRITGRSVRVMEVAVEHLASKPDLARGGKVGLVGFSFAGGLALVAAAGDRVRDRLSYVASIGGHHDLGRVLRFYLSDEISTPRGRKKLAAHEYGMVVLLHHALDDLTPAADRALLGQAVRKWLGEDRELARGLAAKLSTDRAKQLFTSLADGKLGERVPELGAWLERHVADFSALSPKGGLARIRAPVYLLHGSGDTVIPPSELEWAQAELGGKEHNALVSSAIDHVSPGGVGGFFAKLALADFLARLL